LNWVLVSDDVVSNTVLNAGAGYGIITGVKAARKITVEVPPDLLKRAQQASGSGITQTVNTGLRLVAASHAYAHLRQLRGKVSFSRPIADLKADR
jgi:hypothetical protein